VHGLSGRAGRWAGNATAAVQAEFGAQGGDVESGLLHLGASVGDAVAYQLGRLAVAGVGVVGDGQYVVNGLGRRCLWRPTSGRCTRR
jgi:hypothetical protein